MGALSRNADSDAILDVMNLAPKGEEHRMNAVLASTWPPHPDPHAVQQTRRVTRSLAKTPSR
jgi:hypothetical protein